MRAKKSLGQNFLVDTAIVGNIVDALNVCDGDTIIEIGPGRGGLTDVILEKGAHVIGIEIDQRLVQTLRTQFHFQSDFKVIEADILKFDLRSLLGSFEPDKVKLVGNLPYYISTAILQKLAAERSLLARLVLMLQREVVERITAEAGNSERGYLTVMTEACFEIVRLVDVPPDAFEPRPKVWSSVIVLSPKPPSDCDQPGFRALVSAGFSQKRKTIFNNLKQIEKNAGVLLDKLKIDPRRRAETLSLSEWTAIFHEQKKNADSA